MLVGLDRKPVRFFEWRLPYLLLLRETVLIISGAEAALLEVKYEYFTGGFLAAMYSRQAGTCRGFLFILVLDSSWSWLLGGCLFPCRMAAVVKRRPSFFFSPAC